jgi:hypothetical protein
VETHAEKVAGSRKLEPVEVEGLGTEGEGVDVGEEPTATLELPSEIVKGWPAELIAGLTGESVTVGDARAPPDDESGAIIAPADASAAAPSMMIDTTMANPTARLRGDKRCAFIPYLGDWNDGASEHLRQERPRGPA